MSEAARIEELSREDLLGVIDDFAKNWLAHDGLWFLAVEERYGIEIAIELDRAAWSSFTRIEAKRIMKRLGMEPGGGIRALSRALSFRLYARLNDQEIVQETPSKLVFRMRTCRVQDARKNKGLPDFPCKTVGIVEYSEFASTIDPRIETKCVGCPPDPHPETWWCTWEFTLRDG